MNTFLWVDQRASAPSPTQVVAYLRNNGWNVVASASPWATATKREADRELDLEVPQSTEGGGYARAVHLLLTDMARIEGRSPASILTDIRTSTVDVVRLAIDSPATRDGRIPVEAGHRVYVAARDMLLAAACSVDDPRPAFPRRKTADAMELIRRARFGQTEVGSFVLKIECDVPQRLAIATEDEGDTDAPMERRTCLRLAQALTGVCEAARESTSSQNIDPFRRRVEKGVSANLCEAIAEILDASAAESLRASFSFASHRPLQGYRPPDAYFGSDSVDPLREAALRLREAATYDDFEVTGHVVRLESKEPANGGTAIVHAEVDSGWRHVAVTLDPKDYATAIEAHRTGSIARCAGSLRKVGRAWVLENPRGLSIAVER